MRGRLLDPEEGPRLFDGNKLHFTMPFKGRRFTAIFFYRSSCIDRTPTLVRGFCERLGIKLPPSSAPVQELMGIDHELIQMALSGTAVKFELGRQCRRSPNGWKGRMRLLAWQ